MAKSPKYEIIKAKEDVMKRNDELTAISADKNGSTSVPPNCVQSVSSEEYRQAIDRLSEQIRQMAKPMAETQEAMRKSLEPMVGLSRAIGEMMDAFAVQMQPLVLSYRDFLLALSKSGLASGDTTVKIAPDDTKKSAITVEATRTVKKGEVEHQQSQTFNAELVGESRAILEKIERTVEKKLSYADVEKWLDENGMKAITVKVVSLVRKEANLLINGVKIAIEPLSRQDLFLKAFFNEENKPDEDTNDFGLDVEELYFVIDSPTDPNLPNFRDKSEKKKFLDGREKSYQNIKDAINRKVQMETGLKKFILWLSTEKCWKINPDYLN